MSDTNCNIVTCIAPVNIAVIKYWGKRDEKLILPLNSSLSGTLSTDHMCAKTTVSTQPSFKTDRIWLNGKEESFDNPRLRTCLAEIKKRAKVEGKIREEELSWGVHICSVNNFPTAAGLASSAAGYACLVYSLAKLFKIEGEISSIARQGSGSACRSLYGGFVEWIAGTDPTGVDSVAKVVLDENHWPQMRVLILVVNDNKKTTSSTNGMQNSVETSELLQHRVQKCVPHKMNLMKKAILEKDFETFAEVTMKDSNQFHAVCLDTFPPCVYMNDVSHAIANLVHLINKHAGKNIVAYTFDAGPNACLYLLEENVPLVLAAVKHTFPFPSSQSSFIKGMPFDHTPINLEGMIGKVNVWESGALRYLIYTKVGSGPEVISHSHLLDLQGFPCVE